MSGGRSLFQGMGIGASGYPMITCLYYENGEPVISLYARDAARYGKGGAAGKAQVCYRTTTATTAPPKIPSYSTGARCLSIYDLYGQKVCFTPLPVAPPKLEAPKECMPAEDIKFLVERFISYNPAAGARIAGWSADHFCKIMNIVVGDSDQGVGEALEIAKGLPCESLVLSKFTEAVANLGDNIKNNGGKDSTLDPGVDAVSGFANKMLAVATALNPSADLAAMATSSIAAAKASMDVGKGYQTQMFILAVGDILSACIPTPATTQTPPSETDTTQIQTTTITSDIPSAVLPTPEVATPVLQDSQPTYPADAYLPAQVQPEEESEGLDTKTLVIGGILAALAGGIAIAMSNRKKK